MIEQRIRDGLCKLNLHAKVKLISSDTMMDTETPRVLDKVPTLKPFDISILFDHMLDESAWRCSLHMLGFDVVCAKSTLTRSTAM